jgi:uncharacterized membrane protein YqjE
MDALVRALASAVALLLTRAEFASVELSIARAQAMRWLLMALGACVLAMLGLIALSAVIALSLWERFGWMPAAVLAVAYCAGAALLVGRLLQELGSAPPLLSQTFAELAKDRDALFGTSTSTAAAEEERHGG